MANINDAASAYLNTLKQVQGGSAASDIAKGSAVPAGAPSFGDILKQSAEAAIGAQHRSEQTSAASLLGKADMTEVLQAVNDAEVALNTVLAVRDRVVQAYQEIMRTPI
ncbi:MAG: flagellar hook-basal body complex protein FliE [Alphaproteobacteria bacterium]|nr:flagellar hook-basal body complex protein FliE [Alphaproteobacteria bacterium]HRI75990.1 flagellar hook-basal body complex protein FliE [Alphaproteobacteria bacterium]